MAVGFGREVWFYFSGSVGGTCRRACPAFGGPRLTMVRERVAGSGLLPGATLGRDLDPGRRRSAAQLLSGQGRGRRRAASHGPVRPEDPGLDAGGCASLVQPRPGAGDRQLRSPCPAKTRGRRRNTSLFLSGQVPVRGTFSFGCARSRASSRACPASRASRTPLLPPIKRRIAWVEGGVSV